MEAIKIIFLDVDGVLNNEKTTRTTKSGFTFVSRRHLKNLKHIVEETGAKVILSSDWRYGWDDPTLNQDFLELKRELARYGIRLYGVTSELMTTHRGTEIQAWLDKHPETDRFVILDDRNDMEPNMDRLVRTVMRRGLGTEETEQEQTALHSVRAALFLLVCSTGEF